MERNEGGAYRDQNKSFLMKMREQAMAKKAAAAGGGGGSSSGSQTAVGEGAAAANNKAMFLGMRAAAQGGSTAADEAKAKAAAEAKAAEEARERELREKEAAERQAFKEAEAKREKEEAEKKEKEQKEKEEQEQKEREEREKEEQAAKPAEPEPAAAQEAEPEPEPEPEPESQPVTSQPKSSEPAQPTSSGGPKPVRCKAVIPYEAKKKGELSFNKDDIIFVPKFDQKAKALAGVCKGKSGWFPANCVINTENGERCGPPMKSVAVRCRAVGNYVAKNEGELSLTQGDVVFVTMKTAGAMWTGVKQGKVGKFPRQFVIDEEEQKKIEAEKAAGKIKVTTCCAIKPYNGRDGELTFTYGDHVVVPKKTNSNMWQGVFKGNVGYFPASYVVDMAEYSKEQITQLIEVEKQMADNQPELSGGPGFETFDDGPDPFAPPGQQQNVNDDPWAPKVLDPNAGFNNPAFGGSSAGAPADDPWAPKTLQPAQRSGGAPMLGGIDVSAYEAVAEPVAPSTKSQGWSCDACTYVNKDMQASQCEMCQVFRGGAQPSAVVQPDGQWNCVACTFLNRPEALACSMCAVERPTADPLAVSLQNEEIAAAQLGHLSMTQQPGQSPVSSQDEAKMRKAIAKAEKEEAKRLAKQQKEAEKIAKKEQKLMKKASKKMMKTGSSSA